MVASHLFRKEQAAQQLKTFKHAHSHEDDESVLKLLNGWIKAVERYTNAFQDTPGGTTSVHQ